MFDGSERWIEIAVSPDMATMPFTTLSPRSRITSVPYAIKTRGIFTDAAGNVGIGTTSPGQKLSVAGVVESTSGGFRFPDGSLQATAASTAASPWFQSDSGGAVGWGGNTYLQTDVPPVTFLAIASGGGHNLGIRDDGTLVGWGSSVNGETLVPFGVFTAIAAGTRHSLAISRDGAAVGWGANESGQIDVVGGTYTAITAGGLHSLAIASDGTLVGWGSNSFGQTSVPSGTFIHVAAGGLHSLAIRSDGTLVGWGDNAAGQTNVPSGTFIHVAAGGAHRLAIRSDGTLAAWGLNDFGQADAPSGTFVAVAAGLQHSIALRTDETLAGWGLNDNGQTDVPSGTFKAVAAGFNHSLAIMRTTALDGGASVNLLHVWGDTRIGDDVFVGDDAFLADDLVIGGNATIYQSLSVASSDVVAVSGRSSANGGYGVRGEASDLGAGVNYGGHFTAAADSGRGVFARASDTSGVNYGLWAETPSTNGRAVNAWSTATNGQTYAVNARNDSPAGTALFGWAQADSGTNYGVYAITDSPNGYAGYFDGRGFFSGDVSIGDIFDPRQMWVSGGGYFGGDVGIGVNPPAAKLEVAFVGRDGLLLDGDGTGDAFVSIENGQGGSNHYLFDNVADGHALTLESAIGRDLVFNTNSNQPRMRITSAGSVGIGTASPGSFLLAVNGTAAKPGGGSWSSFSDARLKRNVQPMTGTLDKLLALRGYTFEFTDDAIEKRLALPGPQFGLMAQEVEQVFPDWVEEDAEGYKFVTERGATALLVEALRELRAETLSLRAEIAALQSRLDAREATHAEGRP